MDNMAVDPSQDIGYVKGMVRGLDRRLDDTQENMKRRFDEQAMALRELKKTLDTIDSTLQHRDGASAAYKKIGGLFGAIFGAIAGALAAAMSGKTFGGY